MFLTVKNKCLDISHINAVIFDMDGTLVESEHIWSEAKQSIARDAGINITEDGLNKYIGRGLTILLMRCSRQCINHIAQN
jgi:beta-phosphoglucomutase-like phosphatase (HAD superfamily)